MGFGQEEVSTSRGSRFRLECKWQAESRLRGVGVRGQKRSTQAAMGGLVISFQSGPLARQGGATLPERLGSGVPAC